MWPVGRSGGPIVQDADQSGVDFLREAGAHVVRMGPGAFQQGLPAIGAEGVRAGGREIGAGAVQASESLAEWGAVFLADTAGPDPGEEGGNGGAAIREVAERIAVAALYRQGAGHAALGQVLHQRQKPRQVGRIDALFIEREDEVARGGAQGVVAVLDALGDAAERDQLADVVFGEERGEGFVGDFGVDRHLTSERRGELEGDVLVG